MIPESLWNLLLGMAGIFIVMGILYFALKILHRLRPGEDQEDLD
jgi:hypothetical protein